MESERKYTIKELRARKDVTQEQAARDLGISVQTYNAWERDISNVAISKVMAVAEYYGVQLSQIFLRRNMN
ncbi:MAG: helix-turn-helix transcriptional regulator [Butyrivibrio sp.]|jgi:DNA-binding XRE family transcriptional regulator|nr:helix-turn-helix transcriptional regulator [Butyrivibrio sp.]